MQKYRLKIGDVLAPLLVLLFSGVLFGVAAARRTSVLQVEIRCGEERTVCSLETDAEYRFEHNGHTVVVTVGRGEAYVSFADCPDRLCVRSGKIPGDTRAIVCVPAGVTVRALAEGGGYDAVAG